MISKKMVGFVQNNSVIRAMFEEGKIMAAKYGKENVYDFSLGNPSVEPPKEITEAIVEIATKEEPNLVHGYMSNSGYEDVREAIAQSLNGRFGTTFTQKNILMTVGAAGGLNVIFKTLLNPGDEVIAFAPYFVEYRSYVRNYDGEIVEISPNTETFQPNLAELAEKITPKTKAVIVNTPNNPTGVVYTEETIQAMAKVLCEKEKELGTSIYLISDEPYRELVYTDVEPPYLTKYYHNTIVGYSFSKSLSLPGERIGYLVIPDTVDDADDVIAAATIANRILGYVNAPSLMQRVVAKCLDAKVDVDTYRKNRDLLYKTLTDNGFTCAKPDGAFYLFVKAPDGDDKAFTNRAKAERLLIVPGSSFACAGYCRVAYCVSYEMIERSIPSWESLAKSYGLKG
ncbi:MAG: pyridoxal phosphate-dependent aminotransferase [Lachnospiraceae bacterium]|nr:pyridoxal phosphate-dependent aminotransferase [Lachnospiraceae bacterium]